MSGSLYWELLSETRWKRWTVVVLCAAALFFLYFFGLTRTGLLGPDEPRYAAIGRTMAQTGDWITPGLWGSPWFEKPPLLYWMTAIGFNAGLDPDLAPRLPVALASVVFLIYFFAALRREFGEQAAFYATAILANSAGWLAYSHVAVTDLPMSAAFSASMLMVIRRPRDLRSLISTGVLLGLAVLAKGLVPLALFVPALWFLRRQFKHALVILGAAAIVAAPWYALVTWRNGTPFLEDFFVKQHFGRFASTALGHEQPFWFYLPVLLAGFFPWTPFLALLFQRGTYKDNRAVFLLAWLLWGLVFFSVFLNKLPGYLLPMLPAGAALLGIAIAGEQERSAKTIALLVASAALLLFIPAIQEILPDALISGFSHTRIRVAPAWIFPALLVAIVCLLFERVRRRQAAIATIALATTIAVLLLLCQVYPVLDRVYSARGLWNSRSQSVTCVSQADRSRSYGLNYYAGHKLPDCN